MGSPSPATDYIEARLIVDYLCQIGANCTVIETTAGYAAINRFMKVELGDMMPINYFGRA